jgi:hypothetical protein
MAIVLLGSTSGSVTLQEPAVAGTTVLSLPTSSGTFITTGSSGQSIPRAALPTGSVLQVLSTTKTDTFSTTSTSFTDITGLSVLITPISATSKIFVIASLCGSVNGGTNTAQYRLMRDSTAIAVGDAAGSRTRSSSGLNYQIDSNRLDSYTFQTLDSPTTTSAITYKVQMLTSASTAYIGRTFSDLDAGTWSRTACTITVMEIAA